VLSGPAKTRYGLYGHGDHVRNSGPYKGTYTIRYGEKLEDWARKIKESGAKPAMEVFNTGNLREARNLIELEIE
jgi:hypothetical protein